MARILNEQKSSIGSPYVFYSVYGTEVSGSRTTNSVKVRIQVDSHLQYSSSSLGSGYPLTAYIKLNGTEYSLPIKASNTSWSGTTTHTYTKDITLTGIQATATSLTGIKFRVSPQDSGYLPSTSCSNITITRGHNIPSGVSYTMVETNPVLLNVGITDDVIVENLSIKQFNVSYTLHDGATIKDVGIYNRTALITSTTNPFNIDLNQTTLLKDLTYPTKIPISGFATDSLNTRGFSSTDLYDFISYTPVILNNSTTIAKRVGQLSGQVSLDINGTFFNGIVGNIDQTSYKPTLKYKFWKLGDTEPSTYTNTIPQADITIVDNTFSVSSLNIGSTTETDTNYFDPEYAYRIKIYVEDNFTSLESNELQIQVGEALWTEYKDRVDFKKITIQGLDIKDYNVLWQGTPVYVIDTHTLALSDLVSNQKNGIVLVWQAYSGGQAQAYDFNYTFIPKFHTAVHNGAGLVCWLSNSTGTSLGAKYIYVSDNQIKGNANNGTGRTQRANSNIYTNNNEWVLTAILGV